MSGSTLSIVDSEIAVLRAILDNPGAHCINDLKPGDFTFPRDKIFILMRNLHRAGVLDYPNVHAEADKSGLLDQLGGNRQLKELLADAEELLPGDDFDRKKADLHDYAARRAGRECLAEIRQLIEDKSQPFDGRAILRTVVSKVADTRARKPYLEPLAPSQCRDWAMPEDYILAGDYHLTRGGITVIGGVPGCGKSRVAVALGIAGATGSEWMGLDVKSRFRTLIVQAENGPARLKEEFGEIGDPDGVNLDDYIRVTPSPDLGLPLHDEAFRDELREHIENLEPGVVVFDPWNRMVLDDRQKDYRAAIDWINACLPTDPVRKPAVIIVAHLRKQSAGDGKKRGRDLLPELSGSAMIGSAARSVFVLEHGSPDDDCDVVVWTCAKNNDGREGPSSAWHRRNGLFTPADEFDLEKYFAGEPGGRIKIAAHDVAEAIGGGVARRVAASRLMDSTGCGKSAAYAAVEPGGRFGSHIDETAEGTLIWSP